LGLELGLQLGELCGEGVGGVVPIYGLLQAIDALLERGEAVRRGRQVWPQCGARRLQLRQALVEVAEGVRGLALGLALGVDLGLELGELCGEGVGGVVPICGLLQAIDALA